VEGENNVVLYRKGEKEDIKEDRITGYSRKLHVQTSGSKEAEVINWNEVNFKIWEIKEGEGLSAISLLKRLYKNDPHTQPSTTKISLMHLFDKIQTFDSYKEFKVRTEGWDKEDEEKYKDTEKYPKFLRHSNDELWYEENINEKVFEKFGRKEDWQEQLKKANELHEGIKKDIKQLEIKAKFCKYYAMLASDGDNMGNWLGGDYLSPGANLEQYHMDLSTALTQYASENQKLDAPQGKYIYAGGEDFLGFLNLQSAFSKLADMHENYTKETTKIYITYDKDIIGDGKTKGFTLSAGLLIAHYKEPLSEVVTQTHALEKKVKDSGKNMFAVKVMKHSGAEAMCMYNWQMLEHLQYIAEKLISDFSNTFITELTRLVELLDYTINETFWVNEIERLVKRSDQKKPRADTDNTVKEFTSKLKTLWEADKARFIDNKAAFDNFLNMLSICDFMERQTGG
jgi:CRISPR-associated protein Cmr2